jgi:lysophospholipase L1-like esterase
MTRSLAAALLGVSCLLACTSAAHAQSTAAKTKATPAKANVSKTKATPAKANVSKTKTAKPPAPAPIQNAKAIRPFLKDLAGLQARKPNRVVRVLHFGDSHTAADFWTGRIRERLQAVFGDAGPGLILPGKPVRGYAHAGVQILVGRNWPATTLSSAAGDGLVGLPGSALAGVEGEIFHLRGAFATWSLQVLAADDLTLRYSLHPPSAPEPEPRRENGGAPADASPTADAATVAVAAPTVPMREISRVDVGSQKLLTLSGAPTATGSRLQDLEFTLPAGARLLGIDLRSGRSGVLYDELGLNGAQILYLERWNPTLRKALLADAHASLIVLAYGTNDEGLSPEQRTNYRDRVQALIRTLKAESGASVLVIGPLDRFGKNKQARAALQAGAADVIADLKAACLKEGCAFWDARAAMGGLGSIRHWRERGLAQDDLVHLNVPGYQQLGDLFCDQLLRLKLSPEPPKAPVQRAKHPQ